MYDCQEWAQIRHRKWKSLFHCFKAAYISVTWRKSQLSTLKSKLSVIFTTGEGKLFTVSPRSCEYLF
jgi:hypothetical protein